VIENQFGVLVGERGERNGFGEGVLSAIHLFRAFFRRWSGKLWDNRRNMPNTNYRSAASFTGRKIGVFTIASKNYLAYVRVLLKSVAVVHPEYSLYLCLVDQVEDSFDPRAEIFHVVPSDSIGIAHFNDMAVRYDIMELNTAVKPFMFRWLFDNTSLDSIIYLDPDIRAYSRFDHLEGVLASDASVVLTPHITHPIEDGKSPNDYHMLQAGVFNLGFAAVNRCDEALRFVEWWGRRLETQADADFARNLFTDQRWCDLAPCFLDRLHVLKNPGYNVAYWNLTERVITQLRGEWQANGEPLAFFHFSGVDAGRENIVSKHQDRFKWEDIPACKPLFDDYRQALLQAGWERSKTWAYAYGKTKEGLRIPSVVRQLYRLNYPNSQSFVATSITNELINLCNANSSVLPDESATPITRLMELIHQQRPDLQSAFKLDTYAGRAGFSAWYAAKAFSEYNLPQEFIISAASVVTRSSPVQAPEGQERGHAMIASIRPGDALRPITKASSDPHSHDHNATNARAVWENLPIRVRRHLAPLVYRILADAPATEMNGDHEEFQVSNAKLLANTGPRFKAPATGRIDSLQCLAPIPQLLRGHRYISVLMHMMWCSRPDLQAAFDLNARDGQSAFVSWFEASAQREYGPDGRLLNDRGAISFGATTSASRRPGANLIGYANAELGMGEHVRMSAAALHTTAVKYGVVNFNVGLASRQGASLDFGQIVSGNPFDTNIFHINADQMLTAYCALGRKFFATKYNIAYWAWELSHCPPEWLPAIKMVDEIWAPSRFIQHAFAEKADIPVEYMPLCVTLPEFKRLDRSHFGLSERVFVFLYTFDFFSFLERKNPFAAIRAFKKAFQRMGSEVCLVLKVMNGQEQSPLWMSMKALIDGDLRIIIINETLNRHELVALFATSDCFVSLHRSEGFGRGPAEAMLLGKPVIVTNYSGNTDFTLPANSCLVNFKLIDVKEGQYPLYEGQQWADPDEEQASWYMKKLHAESVYARELGAKGKAYIQENFNQRTIGAIYEKRLQKLGVA